MLQVAFNQSQTKFRWLEQSLKFLNLKLVSPTHTTKFIFKKPDSLVRKSKKIHLPKERRNLIIKASGEKFKSQSVRSPWAHGSEVTTKFEVRSCNHWSENTAVRRLSFLNFTTDWSFSAKRSHQTTKTHETKWSTMAILSYPEVFKTYTGRSVEKYVRTYVCSYEVWNFFYIHRQGEVRLLGQRDRWSQVTWGVSEVLPLWRTQSSHRTGSKFQIPFWVKQHQKQQVPGWKGIEVEHVSSSWKVQI